MFGHFIHVWLFVTPCGCSPPGSSVHGISQARILEWVAMPSCGGSSWPRNRTCVFHIFCIGRRVLYPWRHLGSPIERGRSLNHRHGLVMAEHLAPVKELFGQGGFLGHVQSHPVKCHHLCWHTRPTVFRNGSQRSSTLLFQHQAVIQSFSWACSGASQK